MQTRKFGFRGLTLALAGVLTLGLAACEDTESVPPQLPVTISVSPTGTVDLQVGQTFQVVASVQNATNTGVTFTSSNTAVATVDNNGTVRAVAAGVATITAASQQDPNARAAVVVRVTGTPPPPERPQPTVTISSIVNDQGNPVNTSAVSGRIHVRVEIDRQGSDSVQVRLGNTVVCRQSFTTSTDQSSTEGLSASQAAAEFVCPIETNAVDANGAPRFANGATTISARLFRGGQVAAQASQAITLANQNDVSASIASATQAIGPTGLQWHDGNVTVTVNPQLFGGTATVNRVTVSANVLPAGATDSVTITKTATGTAPFTVTFRADSTAANNGLAGVSTENLVFRVATVTSAGEPGPNRTLSSIRYDNVAPTAGTFAIAEGSFLGANRTLSASGSNAVITGATDPQPGIGGVTVTFAYLANNSTNRALSNSAAFAAGTQVTNANDIPETSASPGILIVARVQDAIGNTTFNRLGSATGGVGVDLTAPTISAVMNDTIFNIENPAPSEFPVSVSDNLSGFDGNALRVSATRLNTSGTSCFIGSGTSCTAVNDDLSVSVGSTNGYYTYTIRARDAAGNLSEPRTIRVLVDTQAPTVSSIQFPVDPQGGADVTFSASLADNLDLDSYMFGIRYGGARTLPMSTLTSVDDTFGAPLTTSASATQTVDFIDVLDMTFAGGTLEAADLAVFGVVDQADNEGQGSQAITNVLTSEFDGIDNGAISAFSVTTSGTGSNICGDGSCGTSNAPTSRTVTATAQRPASGATAVPFSRVHFYVITPDSEYRLIGVDTSAEQSVDPSNRNFRWSVTLTATTLELAEFGGQNIRIIAVGVDAADDGDAVGSSTRTLTVTNS